MKNAETHPSPMRDVIIEESRTTAVTGSDYATLELAELQF